MGFRKTFLLFHLVKYGKHRLLQFFLIRHELHEPILVHAVLAGDLDRLLHVDSQKEQIVSNTEQFVKGLPANNVLLTGARGTGKSSLIRGCLTRYYSAGLRLIEIPITFTERRAGVSKISGSIAAETLKMVFKLRFGR